jgi:hypothetical protein
VQLGAVTPRSAQYSVLNLSRGGMLIRGPQVRPGTTTRFELHGPGIDFVGLCDVVHSTDERTGLRILGCESRAEFDRLVAFRVNAELQRLAGSSPPSLYIG